MYHFGHKILFDGSLIERAVLREKPLFYRVFLFDGSLTGAEHA